MILGYTCQPMVLMAPVGVVRERDINKVSMAIVSKDWGWACIARLLPQHTWKVRCLYDCIHVRYLHHQTGFM